MNLVKDESGQATVFMGLCMAIFLFGFFALAVDAGLLYREKRLVQTAADAGALAAAAGESAGTSITASAQTAAAQNGLTLGTGKGQASVTATTLTGTGTVGYVQVVATVHTPTVFLGLVSSRFNPMDISASAQTTHALPPSAAPALQMAACIRSCIPIFWSTAAAVSAHRTAAFAAAAPAQEPLASTRRKADTSLP